MQQEPKVKYFTPLAKPEKSVVSEAVFTDKLSQGYSKGDAAVLAGYKGVIPNIYGNELSKKPEIKKALAEIFENKARMALRKMTPSKADQTSFAQLATTAATMSDRARLERGQSTQNIGIAAHINISNLSDAELKQYLEEKSRALSTRRDGLRSSNPNKGAM